ncbi:MAG: hypothetical protein AMXMBFR64_46130 [Myxococcales bacterium]
MGSATHNLHIPLPESMNRELREAARELGEPATAVARRALAAWLADRRRAAVRADIAAYAEAHAGSESDLDEDLEAAGAELLAEGGHAEG